jgi:membrane protein
VKVKGDNWLFQLREMLWGEREVLGRQHELRQGGRYLYALARDLLDGQVSMRAMSLVYTTLLSLVPLLALAFSLLKGLGVHNSLEPVLRNFLAPLGPQADVVTRNVIAFVENIKVGVLGSLGVILLLYAVITMIQKVEDAFNYIWRVEIRRGLGQRLGEYLSLTVIGPLAVFLALGMTGSVLSSNVVTHLGKYEPLGLIIYMVGRIVPYFVIVGLFTFLYQFVPNTRVKLSAAFGGGLLAGVLWQSAALAFASFVAASPNYSAIYSGFAIVILLLIWLYLGWLILLIGCQLSYYLQYPQRLTPTRTAPHMSGRSGEFIGLQVVGLVGRRFLGGEPPLTVDQLHREIGTLPEYVDRVVDLLLHHGVLALSGTDADELLPKRDLESMTVAQLWQLLREGFDERPRLRDGLAREVEDLLAGAESGFGRAGGQQTLRQWLSHSGRGEQLPSRSARAHS